MSRSRRRARRPFRRDWNPVLEWGAGKSGALVHLEMRFGAGRGYDLNGSDVSAVRNHARGRDYVQNTESNQPPFNATGGPNGTPSLSNSAGTESVSRANAGMSTPSGGRPTWFAILKTDSAATPTGQIAIALWSAVSAAPTVYFGQTTSTRWARDTWFDPAGQVTLHATGRDGAKGRAARRTITRSMRAIPPRGPIPIRRTRLAVVIGAGLRGSTRSAANTRSS